MKIDDKTYWIKNRLNPSMVICSKCGFVSPIFGSNKCYNCKSDIDSIIENADGVIEELKADFYTQDNLKETVEKSISKLEGIIESSQMTPREEMEMEYQREYKESDEAEFLTELAYKWVELSKNEKETILDMIFQRI